MRGRDKIGKKQKKRQQNVVEERKQVLPLPQQQRRRSGPEGWGGCFFLRREESGGQACACYSRSQHLTCPTAPHPLVLRPMTPLSRPVVSPQDARKHMAASGGGGGGGGRESSKSGVLDRFKLRS